MNLVLLPAVFLFYGVLSLAYSAVLFRALPKNINDNETTSYWACGAFLIGSATLITIFRNDSNLFFTYVVANAVAFLGYLCFNFALDSMASGFSSKKRNLIISCIIFISYCLILYFIGIYLSPKFQTIFVSTMVIITSINVGILGRKIYKNNNNSIALILSISGFINSVLWFLRIPIAISDLAISAFSPNSINIILFICIFLNGIIWYFIFIALLYSESHISELKALERFEGMSRTLPCALYEYYLYPDYTSEFRYISPSIKELIGYSADSIMKDSSLIIERVHPSDKDRFWEVNLESYETGKTFFIEIRLIALDGSLKWVQMSSSPSGEDFKSVTWSGYIIDISDRKDFEERAFKVDLITKENEAISLLLREKEILLASLLKSNRNSVTGALSASIAHELNQPLAASNLNIEFLKMKLDKNELNPELGSEVLASLQSDNKRATDIVRSLRSIFLENSNDSEKSNLNELIEKVLVLVRPEMKKNKIDLSLNLSDYKNITVNPIEIQQVILNLLNNAIQALVSIEKANKTITLNSKINADFLLLSISDNGPGVQENRQKKIFELFNSEKQAGMGLGLWLCMHIIKRHAGHLTYEASQEGGATFLMALPVANFDI
jgi:PAS domain S-box-containing protein